MKLNAGAKQNSKKKDISHPNTPQNMSIKRDFAQF